MEHFSNYLPFRPACANNLSAQLLECSITTKTIKVYETSSMKNKLHQSKSTFFYSFRAIDQATFENFVKGKIVNSPLQTRQFTEKALYLHCDQYSETADHTGWTRQKTARMFLKC